MGIRLGGEAVLRQISSQQCFNLCQSWLLCHPKPEERWLSGAEFQILYANSRSPLLKCKEGRLDKKNFREKKHMRFYLRQWSKSRWTVIHHVKSMCIQSWCQEVTLDLHGPQKKNPSLQSSHEKNIRQITTEESPVRDLTSSLQNCQGHQWQIWDTALGKRSQRKGDY